MKPYTWKHIGIVSITCFVLFGIQYLNGQTFDAQLFISDNSTYIGWESQVGHEYEILNGGSISQITSKVSPIYTSMHSNTVCGIILTNKIGFYRIQDNNWAFKVLDLTNDAMGHAYLYWSCQSNILYRVARCTSLLENTFSILSSNIPATYPMNIYTDTTAIGSGPYFYFVEKLTNTLWERTKNAGGFYRLDIAADGDYFSQDFNTFDGTLLTPQEILGNQLPINTTVGFYNPDAPTYNYETNTMAGWKPNTNILSWTQGFNLIIPGATGQIYISGEVPTAPSFNKTISNGLNSMTMSYGYPDPIAFTNTTLANIAEDNSSVYIWNSSLTNFDVYTKSSRSGWSCNAMLDPGSSIFYFENSGGSFIWTENKPYTLKVKVKGKRGQS